MKSSNQVFHIIILAIIISTISHFALFAAPRLEFVSKVELDQSENLLESPNWVRINSEGAIIIADLRSLAIHKYSGSGKYLKSYTRKGMGPSEISRIRGIALDEKDRVYISDSKQMKLLRFDNNLNYERYFKFDKFIDGIFIVNGNVPLLSLDSPKGECKLALLTDEMKIGRCLAKETGLGKTRNLNFVGVYLAYDNSGNIYVLDILDNNIEVFDKTFKKIRNIKNANPHFNRIIHKKLDYNDSEDFVEWLHSFSKNIALYTISNKYLAIIHLKTKKASNAYYLDIINLKDGKLVGSITTPSGLQPLCADSAGYLYFLKTDISNDGEDVRFYINKYKIVIP